jgi:hypothetical protein
MAWVQRGSKRYFYRTVRRGRRTTLIYLGSGAAAEEAAAEIERRQPREHHPGSRRHLRLDHRYLVGG